MATFAELALFFGMIVFVFAVLPALLADPRWQRVRHALIAVHIDTPARAAVAWDDDRGES